MIKSNFLVFLTALCLSVALVSCSSDKLSEQTRAEIAQLGQELSSMRYTGAFRTDKTFNDKLVQLSQKIKNNGLEQTPNSLSALQIEWAVLQDRVSAVDDLLPTQKVDDGDLAKLNWAEAFYRSENRQMDEALKLLETIVSKKSTDTVVLLKTNWLMGSIYEKKQMYEKAEKHYNEVLNLGVVSGNMDYAIESMMHLGNVQFTKGELSLAKSNYQKGLEQAKQYHTKRLIPYGYYHLGNIAESDGVTDEALALFEQGILAANELDDESRGFLVELMQRKINNLKLLAN